MQLNELGKASKQASYQIMNASTTDKNKILLRIAATLEEHIPDIIKANQKDLHIAKCANTPEGLIDRMMLNEVRIRQIITGIHQVVALEDPIGSITNMKTMPNGLQIGQMRVALGVVGMIYEARPNVTVDAAILCIKAGNAVILRGSKDILDSNIVLTHYMRKAIATYGYDENIITLLTDTSRETAIKFMKMNAYLDVLIPRGGASLIQATIDQASVPVLETGTGNCHVYVDKDADIENALRIIINAKTSRTSVCNACESVLIHTAIKDDFLIRLLKNLHQHQVCIYADPYICSLSSNCLPACEEDYKKEYLDLALSMKQVTSLEEAIQHINTYSSHHSEVIVSQNYSAIQKFIKEVDSACVYANASTRYSDGFEFGLGAEIGISTQKLHARGPMGLTALTTQKYIILGEGQIR